MQVVPKGCIPYFMLIVRSQTINQSNDLGGYVVKACIIASDKVGNSVLLNHSTVGVSCENSQNIHTIMEYIEEKRNHLSFTGTNHNVKTAVTNIWKDFVMM